MACRTSPRSPSSPAASFTYEFIAKTSGSHMYHSHHNATDQVGRGLLGAFIVEPKDPAKRYDQLYGATPGHRLDQQRHAGRVHDQRAWVPGHVADRRRARRHDRHPVHERGPDDASVAPPRRADAGRGARWLSARSAAFTCDTLGVNPGERYDVVIKCDEPGAWAFHCHVLSHAEGTDGMYGMVTALVVQDQAAAAALKVAGAPAFTCVIPTSA